MEWVFFLIVFVSGYWIATNWSKVIWVRKSVVHVRDNYDNHCWNCKTIIHASQEDNVWYGHKRCKQCNYFICNHCTLSPIMSWPRLYYGPKIAGYPRSMTERYRFTVHAVSVVCYRSIISLPSEKAIPKDSVLGHQIVLRKILASTLRPFTKPKLNLKMRTELR